MTDRKQIVSQIRDPATIWDLAIIGGGATGLGAAIESVTRGYRTVLFEQDDFSKGTSSRSTKLVHGGVRYLAQGKVRLVMEALRERGRLRKNAPHLVRDQPFVIPCYSWWMVPFYTIGLTLYDLMAGKLGIGRSVPLSRGRTREALPGIREKRLRGGVRYFDCQFDDSRMAVNLAQTALEKGAVVLNHCKVTGLLKTDNKVTGLVAEDRETGEVLRIRSKSVVNATGVFVDRILKMDEPGARDMVKPSQGIHLVLDRKFLDGTNALMIPRTSDGRVVFAVPWHNRLVVGTTDVEKHEAELEPCADKKEVAFILETAGRFLDTPPREEDVLSIFTGLRPLAAPLDEGQKTKEISRVHIILVSESGLVSITGGKWTTYRRMAEDVVDRAAGIAGLPPRESVTRDLPIHGYANGMDPKDPYCWYGSDRQKLDALINEDAGMTEVISEKFPLIKAQVILAVREEMALTVEDCLSRRVRALQLDARESIRVAPRVAAIMAEEMGLPDEWIRDQVERFTELAGYYLLEC